jgi:hypothetical protein
MKLELNVPQSQVAAIHTIVQVICSEELAKEISFEECVDDSKLMEKVSEEFVKRIVLWSKKMDALAKLKAKSKTSELTKLKKLAKDSKSSKSTKTSKKKNSKLASTGSES